MPTDLKTRPPDVANNYDDEVAHKYCVHREGKKQAICGYRPDHVPTKDPNADRCLMCVETRICPDCGRPC